MAGYTEVLTWILCSKKEIASLLKHGEDNSAVVIADSRTSEFEVSSLHKTTHLTRENLNTCNW